MTQGKRRTDQRRTSRHRLGGCGAVVALVLAVGGLTGCDDAVRDEFRGAALGSIETGVNAIIDGILEGVFTIATPSPGEDPDDAATEG